MDDKEKNQKTVVAFIAGLLIGGLLVWVFSIAPGNDAAPEDQDTETPRAQNGDANPASASMAGDDEDEDDVDEDVVTSAPEAPQRGSRAEPLSVSGDGAIVVDDQPAGRRVTIASITMPVDDGWIAIHDEYADGSVGNALGAARYSVEDGLTPTTIELLRAMTAGGKYRAVLYAENGDRKFNLGIDAALVKNGVRIEDSFTAN